jgi:hypothetical protein
MIQQDFPLMMICAWLHDGAARDRLQIASLYDGLAAGNPAAFSMFKQERQL